MVSLVDAHCHLDADELAPAEEAWARARAVGVDTIVMAGVDPANWAAQREVAARLPGVHTAFGIHPQLVAELDEATAADHLAALARELATHRPVALGELGIDRLTEARKATLGLQVEIFRAQLRLAIAHDLPLVLHILRADAPALAVLTAEGIPRAGGMVHSFSGSADFARRLVALGLHVSFCGTLTFPQSRRLREAALAVPEERLLVETDSPDQTPEPERAALRGRSNRPEHLPSVVRALADVRGWSFERAAATTRENARRLFRI
ncbi:MAG: TatD family hydrolase [Deltaproteobacteria bacterium]|nr:TatD family hydrolase [Deltaproteobacteria bacterium]